MSRVVCHKCDTCHKIVGPEELAGWIHIGLGGDGCTFRLGMEAGRAYLPAIKYSCLDFCSTDCLVLFVLKGQKEGREERHK